jgi:hypothetical protein
MPGNPLVSENELMRELPSEVGLEVDADVDIESANTEVEGPLDILVIPKCAANPRARAGDALRGTEEPPLDAEPAAGGTAAADGLGIVIGGVEAETRRCHRGGVKGLSSRLCDVLDANPVATDMTCIVSGFPKGSVTVKPVDIGEMGCNAVSSVAYEPC